MSEEVIEQPTQEAPETATTGNEEGQGQEQNHEGEGRYVKAVPIREHINVRRERNAYRDEANALRAELEAAKSGRQAPTEGSEFTIPPRPKPEDFVEKGREAYDEALDKWEQERDQIVEKRAEQKITKSAEERKAKEHADAVTNSFIEATRAAVADVPDIEDRVASLNDPDIVRSVHPSIWLDIMASEAAIDIVVELTDDMRALQKIMGNPITAARELGKMEARILARKESPVKTAEPVKPVPAATRTVRGVAPAQKTLADIARTGTMAEYEAARRAGIR